MALVLGGAAFGAWNSWANHGGGLAPVYVSKVIGVAWGWLAVGALVQWSTPRWRVSFGRGSAFYTAAILAYYASDFHAGVYTNLPLPPDLLGNPPSGYAVGTDWAALVWDAVVWLVIAHVLAALVAGLGVLRRHGGVLALLATLAVPAYLLYNAVTTWRWAAGHPHMDIGGSTAAVSRCLTIVSCALCLLGLAWSLHRQRSSRE